jgi:uncharacterized membrane protein (DUF373 family)
MLNITTILFLSSIVLLICLAIFCLIYTINKRIQSLKKQRQWGNTIDQILIMLAAAEIAQAEWNLRNISDN